MRIFLRIYGEFGSMCLITAFYVEIFSWKINPAKDLIPPRYEWTYFKSLFLSRRSAVVATAWHPGGTCMVSCDKNKHVVLWTDIWWQENIWGGEPEDTQNWAMEEIISWRIRKWWSKMVRQSQTNNFCEGGSSI